MKTKIMTRILCSALLTQVVMLPDFLFSQSDFYRGKTITLLHGRAPGGSGDFRVRAVLPFLQKYIPGNPTFVHEYMDGGGGRKAANHIFALTRTDGLVIGNVGGGVVANAVLGEQGVQYDLDKLPFIGSPYSATHYVLATRKEAGLTSLEKLRAATGIRIGAQSVGHTNNTDERVDVWLVEKIEHNIRVALECCRHRGPERDRMISIGHRVLAVRTVIARRIEVQIQDDVQARCCGAIYRSLDCRLVVLPRVRLSKGAARVVDHRLPKPTCLVQGDANCIETPRLNHREVRRTTAPRVLIHPGLVLYGITFEARTIRDLQAKHGAVLVDKVLAEHIDG